MMATEDEEQEQLEMLQARSSSKPQPVIDKRQTSCGFGGIRGVLAGKVGSFSGCGWRTPTSPTSTTGAQKLLLGIGGVIEREIAARAQTKSEPLSPVSCTYTPKPAPVRRQLSSRDAEVLSPTHNLSQQSK